MRIPLESFYSPSESWRCNKYNEIRLVAETDGTTCFATCLVLLMWTKTRNAGNSQGPTYYQISLPKTSFREFRENNKPLIEQFDLSSSEDDLTC